MTAPLVWIPGHLCDAWLFEDAMGRWPGSEHLADVRSDDTIAAMATRLLDCFPGPLVLAGLSMGGMVAMETIARAPDRIAGALLMSTDPFAARDKEKTWRAAEMDTVRKEGTAGYAERFVAKFFAHDPDVATRLGPRVLAHASTVRAEVCLAQARALDGRADRIAAMSAFAGPVEVLVGAEDRVCPAKLHHALASACPRACLTEVQGCGHLSSLEAPDRIAAALDRLGTRLAG